MLLEQVAADHCIMLHSGRVFDLANPEESDFLVEDIAHGLANTCRYVGQCDRFYSVAEHSVLVSQSVRHAHLAALFHDAAEAFLGDISGPLKQLLPEIKSVELRIQRVIFERLNIGWPAPPEVKEADYAVMVAEQKVLMPAGTNKWLTARVSAASVPIMQLQPENAKKLFLQRYEELRRQ